MSQDHDIGGDEIGGGPGVVRRPPLLVALMAQAIAALVVFGTAFTVGTAAGIEPPLMTSLWLQGAVAAFLGHRFGLAPWWLPIQLLLPPAAGWASAWDLPGWAFGAAFAVLALAYWNSARGVPLYLSNEKTKQALAGLLPADMIGLRVADLGSGFGGPALALARARPDAHVTGVESAPLLFAVAWLRMRVSGLGNVSLRYGDFWALDLAPFDVVYCFLSPVPMPRLFDKATDEMRAGTLLVSNTFAVPGREPTDTVEVDDGRRTQLYLWRM